MVHLEGGHLRIVRPHRLPGGKPSPDKALAELVLDAGDDELEQLLEGRKRLRRGLREKFQTAKPWR
jgi:hypothetical protein